MDKFEKHIRKIYDQQLKPVNSSRAWERFEAEHLDQKRHKRGILLICIILIFGFSAGWFLYEAALHEGGKGEDILISDSSKFIQVTSNETLTNKLRVKEDSEVQDESNVQGSVEESTQNLELYGIANATAINLKEKKQPKEEVFNRQGDGAIDYFEGSNTFMLDKKGTSQSKKKAEKQNKGSIINDAIIVSLEICQLATSPKLGNTLTLLDSKSTSIRIAEPRAKKWISYGVYAGTNFLEHRFVNHSSGANLGFVLQAKLTNHISIHAIAGYSFIDLETRVNSKDLRIDGLNISTRSLEVKSINKSIHQLNSGLELAFSAFSSKNFNIDVCGGLITKVDFSAAQVYQIYEDNMEQEIQKLTASNYYYPLFYRLSSGISYSLHETRIALRPYYMHNVFSSEINHPFEWGFNTEILF